MNRVMVGWLMGLVGAVVGAALGLAIFRWLLGRGYYAMILPGALLGLGANLASPSRSVARGIVVGTAALAVGLVTEWCYYPFKADQTLTDFVRHLPDIDSVSLLMIALGGIFAFWWGKDQSPWLGRGRRSTQPVQVKDRVEGHDGGAA